MNENSLPLVTIITPVYNGADYLDDLIKSVQTEDYHILSTLLLMMVLPIMAQQLE